MKQRYLLLLFIAVVYISGNFVIDRWRTNLYHGDSNGYYLHVVSFFINQDVGKYDKSIRSLRSVIPSSLDPGEGKYGISTTEKGKRYIKYTLGTGVMEIPFFLAAHLYAKLSSTYKADGWSLPYHFAIGFSILIYVLIGFHLLIGILGRYFSKTITALVVLAIAFATNLFYHATYVTMAHGFLFFDYCLLIYLTVRFYDAPNLQKALSIGAVIGLITLTRVPEVISVFIPLLWGVYSIGTLKERALFVAKYPKYLLAFLSFLLVFSIQFAYWYYVSGHFIFDPYKGEGFNFLDPQILKGWFHFSNGWLIYTPIMALSLIGWLFLRKYFPTPQLAILAFVGLHVYIHYSYYAWTYYPGLGSRPMVETYPLLSFGMAAFFLFCFNRRKWLGWVPITSIILFTWLNLFQTWQMQKGIIWSERGNLAFYLETFGMLTPTINSLRAFDSGETQPDPTKLIFVKTLASDDFEDSTTFSTSSEIKHNGNYSFIDTTEFPKWKQEITLGQVQPKDWLQVGIVAFMRNEDIIYNRDHCEDLVVEMYDEKGEIQKWTSIKISTHIGNKNYNIWTTGDVNRWHEASFFIQLPGGMNPQWKMNVYFWNRNGQKLYLDDFFIDHYIKKGTTS